MTMFYALDKDPQACARAMADAHLRRAVTDAALLLSSAWHYLHHPLQHAEDDPAALGAVFEDRTRPAANAAEPHPTIQADGPFSVSDGVTAHLLLGQRICAGGYYHDPWPAWARLRSVHYRWLWRVGVAAAEEFEWRFSQQHAARAALRTLEPLPPRLLAPPHGWLTFPYALPDGYWCEDVVGSYRVCYAAGRAWDLAYTRRAPPGWLV